ncbi:MAG: NAD(P)-dependent alcohol dehydrogenase [Verrucomicrobia bacterium]|nr:NAD(P)-dependent alcohol dehydrogenase [Verrucomicrobiota bacterium]
MNAIVYEKYGPPDVLQLREVEKPTPKNDEVLIRIHAAAVTATDPVDRKGEPYVARIFSGLRKPKHPIPGGMLAGEIEASGKDVKRFKVGDQVFGSTGLTLGAHAEYKCLPEDEALARIPGGMSYEEAAATVDGALTALPFLRDEAKIRRGQQVLINGASGSVGTAAVQFAKYYGAEVTGVCSTANVELVKSLGANKVIDYTKEDFTKNDQAYDVIFDAVGKSTFSRCKNSLKKGGVFLSTGPTVGGFFFKTLALLLEMLWTSKIGDKRAIFAATGLRSSSEKTEDLVFLTKLIEAGTIKSVIDKRYRLEQIAEAHTYVETGHKVGNVVLTLVHDPNT